MRVIRKIIAAGDKRKSRFHTEQDLFIGWEKVFRQAPVALSQKIRRYLGQERSPMPWWPVDAIDKVDGLLHRNMNCIEFGSGGSTIWMANRVRNIVSREHNKEWAEMISARARREALTNIDLQYRPGLSYYDLKGLAKYDFAVIDGEYRWKCLEALRNRMNPGGVIYFDNSDSDKDKKHYREFDFVGSHRAQNLAFDLERQGGVEIESIHGMIAGEFFAGSGMLIKFRQNRAARDLGMGND